MGCVVFDLQIQPALGHRRVDPLGNTRHIEMEVDPVGVLFRDSQRGMQEQPVQKTAHLAQSASRQKLEPPVRQNIPIFIGRFLICAPHSVPEGKRLAGSDYQSIKHLCRQFAVVSLVLLVGQLIPRFVVVERPACSKERMGQHHVGACF